MEINLPPMPEVGISPICPNGYTADQMTAYAREAVLAERERYEVLRAFVAQGVDLLKGSPDSGNMTYDDAKKWVDKKVDENCAAAIR